MTCQVMFLGPWDCFGESSTPLPNLLSKLRPVHCCVQPSVRLGDVGEESATAKVASVANYPMDAWKALSHAMDPLWGDEQGAQLVVELLKVRGFHAT